MEEFLLLLFYKVTALIWVPPIKFTVLVTPGFMIAESGMFHHLDFSLLFKIK